MTLTYPPDFTYPSDKVVTAYKAALAIAGLVPTRGTVVQAGGCVGLWPLALSSVFARVVTCEPEPRNFRYLTANTATATNVEAHQIALGAAAGSVGLRRPKCKAGLWRVQGDGDIPMVTVDALIGDAPVDALVLDVEGSELAALHGAAHVIGTQHPALWLEFRDHTADLESWLTAHGYTRPMKAIGGDRYSVHASRVAA